MVEPPPAADLVAMVTLLKGYFPGRDPKRSGQPCWLYALRESGDPATWEAGGCRPWKGTCRYDHSLAKYIWAMVKTAQEKGWTAVRGSPLPAELVGTEHGTRQYGLCTYWAYGNPACQGCPDTGNFRHIAGLAQWYVMCLGARWVRGRTGVADDSPLGKDFREHRQSLMALGLWPVGPGEHGFASGKPFAWPGDWV